MKTVWGRVVADPRNRVWDLWVIGIFLDWSFEGGGMDRRKLNKWIQRDGQDVM